MPAAHAFCWVPQRHVAPVHVSPAAQVVPQPPQSDSAELRSTHSPPQHVRPVEQKAPPVLAAPHATQLPETHT